MILFYREKDPLSLRLREEVKSKFTDEGVTICHSIRDILLVTPQKHRHDDVLLVVLTNKDDLHTLVEHKKDLWGYRLLLALPDSNSETLSSAFTLYPRYVCETKDDFSGLCQVLGKLIAHH